MGGQAIIPFEHPDAVLSHTGPPDNPQKLFFECPGCGCLHGVEPDRWNWDKDPVSPTLRPSILVTWTHGERRIPKRCHSYVRNGHIQFLNDCTHSLKGQTVPLKRVNEKEDDS